MQKDGNVALDPYIGAAVRSLPSKARDVIPPLAMPDMTRGRPHVTYAGDDVAMRDLVNMIIQQRLYRAVAERTSGGARFLDANDFAHCLWTVVPRRNPFNQDITLCPKPCVEGANCHAVLLQQAIAPLRPGAGAIPLMGLLTERETRDFYGNGIWPATTPRHCIVCVLMSQATFALVASQLCPKPRLQFQVEQHIKTGVATSGSTGFLESFTMCPSEESTYPMAPFLLPTTRGVEMRETDGVPRMCFRLSRPKEYWDWEPTTLELYRWSSDGPIPPPIPSNPGRPASPGSAGGSVVSEEDMDAETTVQPPPLKVPVAASAQEGPKEPVRPNPPVAATAAVTKVVAPSAKPSLGFLPAERIPRALPPVSGTERPTTQPMPTPASLNTPDTSAMAPVGCRGLSAWERLMNAAKEKHHPTDAKQGEPPPKATRRPDEVPPRVDFRRRDPKPTTGVSPASKMSSRTKGGNAHQRK